MKTSLNRKYEWIVPLPNFIVGAIWIVFGFVYLFKESFMPYHAVALSSSWEELNPAFQTLILALMRAAGGGFSGWLNDYFTSKQYIIVQR